MTLPVHIQNIILNEVGAGTLPENSRLKYTPEMTAFRKEADEWWAATQRANPDATIAIPNELPDENDRVQWPTGWDIHGDGTRVVGKTVDAFGEPLDTEVEAAIERRAAKKTKGD